jgi:hypothetical protein
MILSTDILLALWRSKGINPLVEYINPFRERLIYSYD